MFECPPTLAARPVTSFAKARPARRAFAFLGHLLGGCPPLFDQLQKHLAAVSQALAFLELVEQRHGFARQLKQHFLATSCAKALAVEPVMDVFGWTLLSASTNPNQVTREFNVGPNFARVYRFVRRTPPIPLKTFNSFVKFGGGFVPACRRTSSDDFISRTTSLVPITRGRVEFVLLCFLPNRHSGRR